MRLLFVCFPYSVHAARWISLVAETGWDIHVFPSQESDDLHVLFDNVTYWPARPENYNPRPDTRVHWESAALQARARGNLSHVEYLACLLREERFDVIHSMEFQHAGYLTLDALDGVTQQRPKWIATNYGSDIYLYRHETSHASRIRAILENCDYYSAECSRDVDMARDMGLAGRLFEICPNGGGIDISKISSLRSHVPPSQRKVVAIKGYEHFAGRALLVLQVIETLATLLRPYRIVVYAPSPAVKDAVHAIRARTGLDIECYAEQEPHEKILALHGQSRTSIANSISDGISTSLLEAMAMGSFPIQSGTACADEWIVHGKTGFVTSPDDPDSIRVAIEAALQNDELVDTAAVMNDQVIRARADSRKIRDRIVRAYCQVTGAALPSLPPLVEHGSDLGHETGEIVLSAGLVPLEPDAVPKVLLSPNAPTPAPGSLPVSVRTSSKRPVLTVITPTYDRADFLPETIATVLAQDFKDFEYLIFDDGSRDDTAAVVKTFDDPRIRYFHHDNRGETRTVNRALLQVSGDFFTIVNSDDPVMPGAFGQLLSVLDKSPEALMAYPDWYCIDDKSNIISEIRLIEYDMEALLTYGSVSIGPGAIFRSSTIENVGLRNPLIRYAADLDFIYRLALCGPMIHVPQLLGTHRVHAGSASIAARSERLALESLYPFQVYSRHPLLAQNLRRRQREAFAVGSFAAAMVTPDARLAVRLLARGFMTHPTAMLRRIREHGSRDLASRLEEIGCTRNSKANVWLQSALGSASRWTALHATLRAILTDPILVLETATEIGLVELETKIRGIGKVPYIGAPVSTPVAAARVEIVVSVIIPFCDGAESVRRAAESTLSQQGAKVEVILVDDGSTTDIGCVETLVRTDERVTLLRKGNAGLDAARNHGLLVARGDYIAFLDAADLLLGHKVSRQLSMMQRNGALFSHTSYYLTYPEREASMGLMRSGTFTGTCYPAIISNCPIAISTVMLHRSIVDAGFNFPTVTTGREDILLWIELAARYTFLGIDEPLSVVELTEESAASALDRQGLGLSGLIVALEHHPLHRRHVDQINVLRGELRRLARTWREAGPEHYARHVRNNVVADAWAKQ